MPIDMLDAAKLMQLRRDFYGNVLRERNVYRPPLPSVGVDRRFLVPARDGRFGVPTTALPSRYRAAAQPLMPRGPFQVSEGQPFIASTGGRLSGVALRGGRFGFTPDELVHGDEGAGFGDQLEEQVKGEIRAQATAGVTDAVRGAWAALVGFLSCWPSRGDLCDPNAVQTYVVARYPEFHNGFPASARVINHVLSARRGDGKPYQSKASIDGILRDLRPTAGELSDYDRRVGDLRRQGGGGAGSYQPPGGYRPPPRFGPQAQTSTGGGVSTGAIAAVGVAAVAAFLLTRRGGGGKGASLSGVRRRRRRK